VHVVAEEDDRVFPSPHHGCHLSHQSLSYNGSCENTTNGKAKTILISLLTTHANPVVFNLFQVAQPLE